MRTSFSPSSARRADPMAQFRVVSEDGGRMTVTEIRARQ